MAVNELSFNQVSTLLNAIVSQATGQTNNTTALDTKGFVTLGQTVLKTGYDTVSNAISQVLGRTLFDIRPYTRKFGGLEASAQQWGNMERELYPLADTFEDDQREPLTDGQSIDMYDVKKPKVQQLNYYGFNKYQNHRTIYRDQLDVAFTGPEQFAEFISMVMSDMVNDLEQAREELARQCVANLIGGTVAGASLTSPATPIAPETVVHLLTEYNTMTSQSLTLADILGDDAIPFAQYAYARIAEIMDLLEERTVLYHTNITSRPTGVTDGAVGYVKRHTPKANQKVYLTSTFMNQFFARVSANTFNERYLSVADYEPVAFWQSPAGSATYPVPEAYYTIKSNPSYISTAGEVVEVTGGQVVAPILGTIFDEKAARYTVVNQWSAATPFNPAGGYYNQYWHMSMKYVNNYTQNHVVLMLD